MKTLNAWTNKELKFVMDAREQGLSYREIHKLHNESGRFPERTYDAICSAVYYQVVDKSVEHTSCRYTPEMDKFLIDHCNLKREELAQKFNAKFGKSVSRRTLAARLSRMGYYWLERTEPAQQVKAIRGRRNDQ